MKNQKGFSLIELLIVVTIIGIIAAIAIPSLLRARMAANETGMIGDSRSVGSANGTYAKANRGCYATDLNSMDGITNPALGTVPFLDVQMAVTGTPTKNGYTREYAADPGPAVCCVIPVPGAPGVPCDDVGTVTFNYIGNATAPNGTGTRNFSSDQTGLICERPVVGIPNGAAWVVDPTGTVPACGTAAGTAPISQ